MVSPVINKATVFDVTALTVPQLKAEARRLADVLDLVNSQRKQIFEEIERQRAKQAAKNRVSGMTAVEKSALLDELKDAP
jgi:hypothetical protein